MQIPGAGDADRRAPALALAHHQPRLPVRFLLLALFFLPVTATAQPEWVRVLDGQFSTGSSSAADVSQDDLGNLYVTGELLGTVDFDPTDAAEPGVDTFTSAGGLDVYVASYTAAGDFRWAFSLGAADTDIGYGIATDGVRVYITGQYSAFTDFDPGPGFQPVNAFSNRSGYVAAYDAATGAYIWAFGLTATNVFADPASIATDGARVYITGTVSTGSATIDLDPGPGSVVVQSSSIDGLLAAYDAATGAYVWGDLLGGAGQANGTALAADATGLYLTGFFRGTNEFDLYGASQTFTSGAFNASDAVIAAYEPATGAVRWAGAIGSPGGTDSGLDLATDGVGLYVTGAFAQVADFDPGPGEQLRASVGNTFDIYLARYDALTGAFSWVTATGSNSSDSGRGVAVDALGVYNTGSFSGAVDFDQTSGTELLTSGSSSAAFVAAYDLTTGLLQSAGAFQGQSTNALSGGRAMVAAGGGVTTVGGFGLTVDFDPTPGTDLRSTSGNASFLTRFASGTALPVELAAFDAHLDGDAARLAWRTEGETANAGFAVEHRTPGADAFREVGWIEGAGTTAETRTYAFDVVGLAPGTHRFRLRQVDLDGSAVTSSEVEVALDGNGALALAAAPNPAPSGMGAVILTAVRSGSATVEAFDVLGRRVAVLHAGAVESGTTLRLPLPELPAGAYVVRAALGSVAETVRISVVR